MQALTDDMVVGMLKAAAVVGRERPEEDATRIAASIVAVSGTARHQHRLDSARFLEIADAAMQSLDAEDDALDGEGSN